jgi:hypothetical protein
VGGRYTRERKDANETTIDTNTSGFFVLSVLGAVRRFTMVVVMVVVVFGFNQRPTERLSEAVANLNRLYLDGVYKNSDFALFSMTAWAIMETLWWLRVATRRSTLARRRR